MDSMCMYDKDRVCDSKCAAWDNANFEDVCTRMQMSSTLNKNLEAIEDKLATISDTLSTKLQNIALNLVDISNGLKDIDESLAEDN